MHPLSSLADALPPPLNWHRFGATQIDLAAVLIVAAAALYLVGVRRIGQDDEGRSWSIRRTFAFFGGLAATFVAVESVIGVYDDVLFYDHMIQHLLLVMVAAPLFAMGAPVELLTRASTGRAHQVVVRALDSRVAGIVAHPIVDFALYCVLIPVTHLTSFYNATLTNELAHDNEHLLFLVVGYLFWRHVVAIEPTKHPLHPGARLLYLALAVPVDTFTGLALFSAAHEMFPAYEQLHRTWGPSLVRDLHLGGTVMWIGGDTLMAIAMAPVAVQWVRYEEQKAAEVDRELDAELAASRSASGADPSAPAVERGP